MTIPINNITPKEARALYRFIKGCNPDNVHKMLGFSVRAHNALIEKLISIGLQEDNGKDVE